MSTDSAAALKEQGNSEFKAGNYQSAIALYSRAIQAAPDVATYYGNRSAAWLMIGQNSSQPKAFEACAKDCQSAIAIDPTFMKGYVRGVKSMVNTGQFAEAEELLSKGLSALPGNQELQAEKSSLEEVKLKVQEGEALLEKGEYSQAQRVFQDVEGRTGAWAKPKLGQARAELGLGHAPIALRLTLQVINADSNNAEAYWIRGEALNRTDNVEQAKKHLQQALRLNPDHSQCQTAYKRIRAIERHVEAGKEAVAKREFEEAVPCFTAAMEADPDNAILVGKMAIERGNAYLRMKDFENAIADCTTAIQLDNTNTAPYITRSTAHQGLQKFEEAVNDLQQAQEIDSENPVIQDRLKRAQVELRKSKRVNYYALLEVSELATEKDITKAYRKMALQWHPDKHQESEEAKAKAEKIFIQMGEAQEILTDPRKRAMYDEGADKEMIEKQLQMEKAQQEMYGGCCRGGFR